MRRLTFRIAVSLLTFSVGIAGALLVRYYHSAERAQILWGSVAPPVQEEIKRGITGEEICNGPFPEVEAIYISEPLNKINRVWYDAHVVIFYRNGDWVRVGDEVRKEDGKFVFSMPDGYIDEVGTWRKEDNGVITISIERRRCHLCGWSENHRKPIIEHWLSKGRIVGRTEIFHRKYRPIREDQIFHDIDRGELGWDMRKILSPCLIRFEVDSEADDY